MVRPKPKNAKWTDEQWRAIAETGQNTLVAAAAGSGKTAVLVERILQKMIVERVDVDRLLIVTFTNSAAQEMRARIAEAVEAALAEHPESAHLQRQLTRLNRAQISTMHGFCTTVLRRYYYKIGLDPSFRIADETEAELLRQEAMESLLEEEYGKAENDDFIRLTECYGNDRGDEGLARLIEEMYDTSLSHPQPDRWLNDVASAYNVPENIGIDDVPWAQELQRDFRDELSGLTAILEKAVHLTKLPGGPVPYREAVLQDLSTVRALQEAANHSWNKLYDEMGHLSFPRLQRVKKGECDSDLQEETKNLRDRAKKRLEELREAFFQQPPQEMLESIRKMAPSVWRLTHLVKRFADKYQRLKQEKAVVDFHDLEQYTLKVLARKEEGQKLVADEPARDYRRRFVEVLIDEYQDTNPVQEAIIRLVTREGGLFMVGDVKQSIYRFRLADPTLFLRKYERYRKDPGEGRRIDLAHNFRSRSEVLAAVNYLFRQFMDKKVGEVDYDDDAALKAKARFPEQPSPPEFILIERKSIEDDGSLDGVTAAEQREIEELKSEQLEARWMARKIRQLVDEGYPVTEKNGTVRPVMYRDIAVLYRSKSRSIPALAEAFQEFGIPVYTEQEGGYFAAVEVSVVLSLLRIIDNPLQDIPLAAVLRSPLVGLNGEELARIRLADRKGRFYDSVMAYVRNEKGELQEKLSRFLRLLNHWRTFARQGALSDLIIDIYRKTGYFDAVGAMPGGRERQANLQALYDRARKYEETSFRGLFRFLRFVRRLEERGGDLSTARALGEQENVVSVMTIHKSKGLEFPIVFVAGLNRPFNFQDVRGAYAFDRQLGFGTKMIDPKNRISYPTIALSAIQKKKKRQQLAEEMRILYVALTRAREKLYLLGTVRDAKKAVQSWAEAVNDKRLLPEYTRLNASAFLDWIGPAVIRHRDAARLRESLGVRLPKPARYTDESTWKIILTDDRRLGENREEKTDHRIETAQALQSGQPVMLKSEEANEVADRLRWRYPHESATKMMAKQSVTEIKRQRESYGQGDESAFIPFGGTIGERPRLMRDKTLAPNERGIIMHTVMQHLDLAVTPDEESVQNAVARLTTRNILTPEEAEIVDTFAITRFFRSEIGKRLLCAKKVWREVPFAVEIPASQAYPDWSGGEEFVFVQGVIDCLFQEEERLILLDYKTDAISGKFPGGFAAARRQLENRYRLQLKFYGEAVEKIFAKPVAEKCLYFFDGGHLLVLKE